MSRKVVVATHGHCFDGLASAALFSDMLQRVEGGSLSFHYLAMGYGPGEGTNIAKMLSGDLNAVLDYRFTTAPSLTWYFDHHVTAFAGDADRATFAERAPAGRYFHDGTYGSCAKLIFDTAERRFGLDMSAYLSLVEWADRIDSARFDDASQAIDTAEPVLRLRAVVQRHGDGPFVRGLVPRLLEPDGLARLATSDDIVKAYEPIEREEARFREAAAKHGKKVGGVVLVDLADVPLDATSSFVVYGLFIDCRYSVLLTRAKTGIYKLSIGYNPWSGRPRTHDIAAICARYGGGGHPVVGGISRPASALAEARSIAQEIALALQA
jgi:hypothetical protein